MQRWRVLGSGVLLRRRLDALLGQSKRRVRDGHHEAGQLRKLHDGVFVGGTAVFRFGQQLHVRYWLLVTRTNSLRIELRRHDEQCDVLRQLHDDVHGGHDLPKQRVQMPRGQSELLGNLRGPRSTERLREWWRLRYGVPIADGGQRRGHVHRHVLRHFLLQFHTDALRIELRRHDEQRVALRQLHDFLHGGNDLPEWRVQVPGRPNRLRGKLREREPAERLREQRRLHGMPRPDVRHGHGDMQRPVLRHFLLREHHDALRIGLRQCAV